MLLSPVCRRILHVNFAVYFAFAFWPIITPIITSLVSALLRGISWGRTTLLSKNFLNQGQSLSCEETGKETSSPYAWVNEIGNCQRSCFFSPPTSHQQHCSSAYYLGELKPKRSTGNTADPYNYHHQFLLHRSRKLSKFPVIDQTNDLMQREHVTVTGGSR